MNAITAKFLSRKFWIAWGTVVVMVANREYDKAVAVALAYLGIQGAVDHKATVNPSLQSEGENSDS